jgi:hypothetical protein
VSAWEVWLVVLFGSVSVTPLGFGTLHRDLIAAVWVAPLLQAAVTLAGTASVVLVARERPVASLVDVSREAFGSWGAGIFLTSFMLYLVTSASVGDLLTLQHVEQTTTLLYSSLWLTGAVVVGCAAYAAALGVAAYCRTTEVLAFVLLPALLATCGVGYLGGLHVSYLPSVPAGPDHLGPLVSFAAWARGYALALALLGTWPARGGRFINLYTASVLAVLCTGALFVYPHLVFPESTFPLLDYPTVAALDTVDASFIGLGNFWSVAQFVWYGALWVALAGTLVGVSRLLRQWLNLSPFVTVPILAASYVVASRSAASLGPLNQARLIEACAVLAYGVIVLGPWLLLFRLRVRPGAAPVPSHA